VTERQKTGRPSKMTDERVTKIVEALRAGNYLETAARYAGISYETLNQWRKEFPEFSESVEQARAEGEVRGVLVINRAEQAGDWRAAAWRLQHAYPERWTARVEVEGNIGLGDLFEQVAKAARERTAEENDG
jgi:transposase